MTFIFLVSVDYSEFDHLLPVIHAVLGRDEDCDVYIVFDQRSILVSPQDLRIQYLKQQPRVTVTNVCSDRVDTLLGIYHGLTPSGLFGRVLRFFIRRVLIRSLPKDEDFALESILTGAGNTRGEYNILMANPRPRFIHWANKFKAVFPKTAVASIPHGLPLFRNSMVDYSDMSVVKPTHSLKPLQSIDYIGVNDHKSKDVLVNGGINEDKIRVLGNLRYSMHWLNQKRVLGLDGPLPPSQPSKVQVLFLMPNPLSNIFFDELFRTIQFLAFYDKFQIIVQFRTGAIPLPKHLKRIKNIAWVKEEYSTSALIDWSKVVLHVGTSVQVEAFQKEKIVIFPRYLTCNLAISESYGAGVTLRSRDDLRNVLGAIQSDFPAYKKQYMQNSGPIKTYVDDHIHETASPSVLDRYLNLLSPTRQKSNDRVMPNPS